MNLLLERLQVSEGQVISRYKASHAQLSLEVRFHFLNECSSFFFSLKLCFMIFELDVELKLPNEHTIVAFELSCVHIQVKHNGLTLFVY